MAAKGQDAGGPDGKGDPGTPLMADSAPIYTKDPEIKDPDLVVKVGETILIVGTLGIWGLAGLYTVGPRECRVILQVSHSGPTVCSARAPTGCTRALLALLGARAAAPPT